jgi:hypothetical protein
MAGLAMMTVRDPSMLDKTLEENIAGLRECDGVQRWEFTDYGSLLRPYTSIDRAGHE